MLRVLNDESQRHYHHGTILLDAHFQILCTLGVTMLIIQINIKCDEEKSHPPKRFHSDGIPHIQTAFIKLPL